MKLHEMIKELEPNTDRTDRILYYLETENLSDREKRVKEQAESIGFLMLPLLEGYDSIEVARLLQQTVSYLQESAQFLKSEEQFKMVYSLQVICNSFMFCTLSLQKTCNQDVSSIKLELFQFLSK
ncbi:hypothetical protein AB832_06845 [Flavobacteriaceae bacterium (ex Bugula neritina AB1)]|nr:hypothetical protein AB832_06845 [Flavobacteriaceae bacterium (ex Bugula neritina AB1)]